VTERVWARGPTEPDRAHIRQTRDGAPVVHLVEGARLGFALCGTWLVADVGSGEHDRFRDCKRCLDLADAIERGDSPEPDWSAHQ
jgi:hypothetical protein